MKNSFLQSAATNGLVIGLGLILLATIDYVAGFYGQNTAFSLLSFAVMIGGLIWAATSYRKKELGNYMSYGQAFSYSISVSVVYSILSIIFTLILTRVIDPGYIDQVYTITEQKLYDAGNLTEEQIDMAMSISRRFTNPGVSSIIGFFSTLFVSTIISLITSAVTMRKNPNPFMEQN